MATILAHAVFLRARKIIHTENRMKVKKKSRDTTKQPPSKISATAERMSISVMTPQIVRTAQAPEKPQSYYTASDVIAIMLGP